MSIPEILLIFFFVPAFFGFGVFAIIVQWKRTQEYNRTLEAFRDTAYSVADSMETMAFNMTLYNSRHVPLEADE